MNKLNHQIQVQNLNHNNIDAYGINEKCKNAKLELKKQKRKDYYKILEIEKSVGDDEIKKAYKKQAMKWHPDKHASASEE